MWKSGSTGKFANAELVHACDTAACLNAELDVLERVHERRTRWKIYIESGACIRAAGGCIRVAGRGVASIPNEAEGNRRAHVHQVLKNCKTTLAGSRMGEACRGLKYRAQRPSHAPSEKLPVDGRRTSLNRVGRRHDQRGHFALGVTGMLSVDQHGAQSDGSVAKDDQGAHTRRILERVQKHGSGGLQRNENGNCML
ncbi:hypothetical protein M405DRAFT_847368 [Rhizopogon salebrosus TDB-379]|nr:hypothetical protein M405DRAFT_847368 [Rhizopogon salebrosus TDB-379]